MPRRKFKKYTAKEPKELGLDKIPKTMYDTGNRNLLKELPLRYDDIEDEEELD